MKTTVQNINGFPSLVDETGLDIAKMYNVDEAIQINRAVNSHEAAQRLAEAARYVDYSTPIIEDTWGDDEVFEIRLTAKGIRDLRAALAEWEAVK